MTEAVQDKKETKMVSLTIDDIKVTVPEGMLVIDAARTVGIDIPVFCYHPKLEPVGMCRMCLVDIGLPERDRATGEPVLNEDGSPKIQFGRTLQTACTTPVSEGMVVVGASDKVQKARQDVVEFLLTSHPLDCPICDKGGECPLQNLTMAFGPGKSRFIYDEKKHLAKHVPLGDLIFLDRERCIQCARCVRFQDEVADDPVIGFENRGRSLQIVTYSEPGFDSYWSGNTTDICPVGALTTADFRFGARPWELLASASVCNQCAVGCNITFNTRREAKSGGSEVIKRAMPRQNEWVNEIWMCDKGRFASYQFTESERLTSPLVRKDGKLVKTSWKLALELVAEKTKTAGKGFTSLAGGRLSNEDLFNIQALTAYVGGQARLYSEMAGGHLTAQVGLTPGSNLADLGAGDAVVVIASDLEEEAPLWWLRVKQAAERGASLVVANPRRTKLDEKAGHTLRYTYGQEAAMALALVSANSPKTPDQGAVVKALVGDKDVKAAAKTIAKAENLVLIYGSEGTGLAVSAELAQACANLLVATGHTGRPNNGLLAAWDKGNAQGAWDVGLRPSQDLTAELKKAKLAYIVAADPARDDPKLAKALEGVGFVVVQELHMTATTKLADVVLPVQAYTEREGTYTSGERRVQRFYPAVPPARGLKADFSVTAEIGNLLGAEMEADIAPFVFKRITETVPAYAGLDYPALAEVVEQWPIVGRDDVYYGGTGYHNNQGLGVQLPNEDGFALKPFKPTVMKKADGLTAVPVTTLLDQGSLLLASKVLSPRLLQPFVVMNPQDAAKAGVDYGSAVMVKLGSLSGLAVAKLDNSLPQGVVLVSRSLGFPIHEPMPLSIKVKKVSVQHE
jgi:NADH-quinone oxidoreductase subunit G